MQKTRLPHQFVREIYRIYLRNLQSDWRDHFDQYLQN